MQGDREICLLAGMDDYLTKPIRPQELVAALGRCQSRAGPSPIEPAPAGREPASQGDVLDPAVRQRLLDSVGSPAFLDELVGTFLEDAPRLVADLREAARRSDAPEVRRAAHTLKSNGANFGAMVLSSLCREVEVMAGTGTLEGVDALVADVETEYERVKAALESWHQELSVT
jgi:HPt (histidine-containing phosphotransfer) domain-containing protein